MKRVIGVVKSGYGISDVVVSHGYQLENGHGELKRSRRGEMRTTWLQFETVMVICNDKTTVRS